MKNNIHYWLEAEQPSAMQAPETDPNQPGAVGSAISPEMEEDDVTQDPQSIETPEEDEKKDYEQWRHDFMQMAIKANNEEMISALNAVRDYDLETQQKRFIEDNLQIFMFRRDANVLKASTEIRALIKKDLDRINPGTVLMQHINRAFESQPLLLQGLIKLGGTFAWKSDLHRKWLAAFLGAVQVGGGAAGKDLIYVEKDYDINISTRLATQWGEINLGKWNLLSQDPKKYLKAGEIESLQDGSPEEKQVLRRKIIIKSIAEHFRKRAFLIHVVTTDGSIHSIGWDLGNSLLDAYKTGKVVVRGKENEEKEILVGDNGDIIPVIDYSILFVKETGEVDDNGYPETEEVPFIERRNSILYLVSDLDTLKIAAAGMSGIFFNSVPYSGNPSDILALQRSVPGLYEIIAKQIV